MERDRERDRPPPSGVPATPLGGAARENALWQRLLTPPLAPGRIGAVERAQDLGIVADEATERKFAGLKWLEDYNATDEQAAHFMPRTNALPALRWAQMMVQEYLCESYRVMDAVLVEVRKSQTGAYIWYFKGTCPHHRYPHSHNRWSLTQYKDNQAFTVFRCFHDGCVRRLGYLPLDATHLEE